MKTTRTERKAAQAATAARIAQAHLEMSAHVARGTCPDCGAPLKRLWALTGWWTCVQRGAVGFRADASKPPCEFQGFTE